MKRVLILGGTGEALELAIQVAEIPNLEVISSLAGRTQQPSLPEGQVRIGGFGGASGLITYLQTEQIDYLIDATHPFAAQISWNAAAASQHCQIPHLRLTRPPWQAIKGDSSGTLNDRWIEVDSMADAAAVLPGLAQRVFLAIGRQDLSTFAQLSDQLSDLWFLMRMIESPPLDMPMPKGKLLLERGPFTIATERELLRTHRIGAIVSKNSGGDATYAKIAAARELSLPVVMVRRPALPVTKQVAEVEGAIAWLSGQI